MEPKNGKNSVLVLFGHIPAKKNEWKRAGRGGIYFDRSETKSEIDALVIQAQSQWAGKPPVSRPSVLVTFYVRDARGDLDNKYTTLQDALVTAGVLKGDNVKHLPGPIQFRGQIDKRTRCS